MIFTIHGKNYVLADSEKVTIENSLNRLIKFEKFIKPETKVKVKVQKYDHEKIYKITVNINLPRGRHLKCQVKNHSLAVVIDQMINPLTQQLNHLKAKIEKKNFRNTGQAMFDRDQKISSEYAVEKLDDVDLDDQNYNDYDHKS